MFNGRLAHGSSINNDAWTTPNLKLLPQAVRREVASEIVARDAFAPTSPDAALGNNSLFHGFVPQGFVILLPFSVHRST